MTYSPAQIDTFRVVNDVRLQMGLSWQYTVIATMTTLTEASALNLASESVPESMNYPHDGVSPGDHDSVGIMQQRANWGSVEQRMNKTYAVTEFLARARTYPIPTDPINWGTVCQAVQVSAYPTRYQENYSQAIRVWESYQKGNGWLMALTDAEQAELLHKTRALYDEFVGPDGKDGKPIRPNFREVTTTRAQGFAAHFGMKDPAA